jgi:hypothetical protein
VPQEVEVAAKIGLGHVTTVQPAIPAALRRGAASRCGAAIELCLVHQEVEATGIDVKLDEVPILDEREGTTDR